MDRSYDIFAINIASTMLGYVYQHGSGALSTNQDLGVKVATPIGNLIGQLLFGWLADVVGRKRMCKSPCPLQNRTSTHRDLQTVSS